MKKTCSKCGQNKHLNAYRNRNNSKDGKHAQCKTCMAEQHRKWKSKETVEERRARKLRDNELALNLKNSGLKECRKCGDIKPLDEFHDRVESKDGKRGDCKSCRHEYSAYWFNKNREKSLADSRAWRKENYEKHRESARKWHQENRDRALANGKKWRQENADRHRENARRWWQENKERINQVKKGWRKRNRPRLLMHSLLHRTLEKCGGEKSERTHKILGYSPEQLQSHIERQFTKGMNWDNYGEWHIDHITSIAEHFRKGETDPSVVNCLTNLRPMWAKDNISKSDKRTHLL